MSRERKFQEPYRTCLILEKPLLDIAHALGITPTNALTWGICSLIEFRLEEVGDKSITPELIEKYREIKDRDLNEMISLIHERDLVQKKIKDLDKTSVTLKAKLESDNELIYVYDDINEERVYVRRIDFNPHVHTRIIQAQVDPEEAEV